MPTLPVRRDDMGRIAHEALDAARHPVRTARATVDAARHPVRTAQTAAEQLRSAVMTVAGRVTEGSPGDAGSTPPPTDAAADAADLAVEVPAEPEPVTARTAPVRSESAEDVVDAIAAETDGEPGDELAPGVEVPLTPRPHLSGDVEAAVAGELDPDPELHEPRQPGTEPLADSSTAKAIRREAQRSSRASDPASRRD